MSSSKQIVRIGPFKELIADGVKVGNIITLAGQVGMTLTGEPVGSDICDQFRQAYENVKTVLAEFDATPDTVIDETWFVTNIPDVMGNVEAIMQIRMDVMGSPATEVSNTLIQVSGLVDPGLCIEIKCIAHV